MNSKKRTSKRKHYDDKLSEELAQLVESLTHSGKKQLDPSEFKRLKNICKRSDKYVQETYTLLLECLSKKHAEVRWSAFQLCNEIFRKSHCFRELVVNNLEKVVKYTTEDLPSPQNVALELRRLALKNIDEWNSEFGERYKKLAIGYKYLQDVKKVDFSALNSIESTTTAWQREIKRQAQAVNEARIKNILADIREKKTDIKQMALSLSNCINLLLPHPDDFFISLEEDECESKEEKPLLKPNDFHNNESESDEDDGSCDAGMREVGMSNIHHSLQLEFIPSSEASIQETPENAAIIENVREYAKVIKDKYLPIIKAWIEVISKSGGHREELVDLIELKGEIDDVLFKFGRMTFISPNDVSSDSDLEEVPDLPEIKPAVPTIHTNKSNEWTIISDETFIKDPASAPGRPVIVKQEPSDENQPSTSGTVSDRKRKLLEVAPKLPFDVDLYHWEDEKLPVPTLLPSSTDGHRFWVGSEANIDELPVPEGSAALRTRVIEFTGSFTPVTHSCRVKLPSGKLCPRRDRFKCPFHGEIVPRDEFGNCINPKDAIRIQELQEKRQQEKPDWQDPKLLAEIKKAIGVDLKMPKKGIRKRKRNHPGLTDLKECENTATKRLEKKIFKKSVMKKVASAMDKLDQRRFRDKFGDQFHYFYDS